MSLCKEVFQVTGFNSLHLTLEFVPLPVSSSEMFSVCTTFFSNVHTFSFLALSKVTEFTWKKKAVLEMRKG